MQDNGGYVPAIFDEQDRFIREYGHLLTVALKSFLRKQNDAMESMRAIAGEPVTETPAYAWLMRLSERRTERSREALTELERIIEISKIDNSGV